MFYIAMLFAHIFLGILCASTVTASYFPDFPSLPDVDDDFGDVDFGVDGDLWWFSSAEPDSEGETVATAGGERTAGDSLDSCKSFQSKNNVYFYGEILATESDVTSAEKCAIACFQAKDNYGFSCKSANFFSSPVKECDLFYDQATFSGDTDNNYPEDTVYVYDIACLGAAATTTAAAATTTTTAIPAGQTTVKPTTKPTTPRTTGTCGKADSRVDTSSQKGSLGGRIVGGVDSKPHGWPWLVSVEKAYADYPNYRKFKCGGSLIRLSDTLEKSDVVVTAEHCITEISSRYVINGGKRVPAAERRIVAGEYDLKKNDTTEVFRIAKSIHSPGGQAPKRPQEVGVPITHKGEDCANGKPDLCAGYGEGGKDSCQGDSGGPLNCELRAGKWTLSGVVSRGNGCAWAANPGFYASVAYNLDWVKKTICAESKFKGDADC